jgi:hypothetical protein
MTLSQAASRRGAPVPAQPKAANTSLVNP